MGKRFSNQFSVSATDALRDELDRLNREYGLESRGEVARRAMELGLPLLRKKLERSPLHNRAGRPA